MKVVVAGCRRVSAPGCPKRNLLPWESLWIAECITAFHKQFPITEIVSGGAFGVDREGELWGVNNNIPVRQFLPDYETHSKLAPLVRNQDMADYADHGIIFWDQISTGTKHMIGCLRLSEKPKNLYILGYNNLERP